ncbi:MAG: hypothetical protein ACPIOQ_24350, partial [Promethearchaeia archaeon]
MTIVAGHNAQKSGLRCRSTSKRRSTPQQRYILRRQRRWHKPFFLFHTLVDWPFSSCRTRLAQKECMLYGFQYT